MKHSRDDNGTGTVVFIPGYKDTAALWDEVIDRLPAAGWCARAVNLRHVDNPDPGRRGAILEGYRDQVLDILHDIDPTARRPLIVVGQSMGAQVAELVAAARPSITAAATSACIASSISSELKTASPLPSNRSNTLPIVRSISR